MRRLFLWLCVLLAGELDRGSAASLPAPERLPEVVDYASPLPLTSSQSP